MENNVSIQMQEDLMQDIIDKVVVTSGTSLSPAQLDALKQSFQFTLSKYSIDENSVNTSIIDAQQENARVLRMFIDAKRIEGRSDTTLYNYAKEMSKLFLTLNKSYKYITSKDIREYMSYRKDVGNLKSSSIANMRQYLMSFFKWCVREELIQKSPMDKIGVVKVDQHVVHVLTDEEQEIIRCACDNERDRAIIDLLSGSGMRVSELCGLNRDDVDFEKGECKVIGKGNKERICFLTGRCKVHLKWYLDSRTDDNPALFVSAHEPHDRITKNGVEWVLRNIAKKSKIPTVRLYPHLYRSTLASNLFNKNVDLGHIQNMLGHSSPATTERSYCRVSTDTIHRDHDVYVD